MLQPTGYKVSSQHCNCWQISRILFSFLNILNIYMPGTGYLVTFILGQHIVPKQHHGIFISHWIFVTVIIRVDILCSVLSSCEVYCSDICRNRPWMPHSANVSAEGKQRKQIIPIVHTRQGPNLKQNIKSWLKSSADEDAGKQVFL